MMPKQSAPAAKDRRKFHKQIAGLRERLGAATPVDLSFLEVLPKFTGKDEPLPFPYGRGRGRKFGRSRRKKADYAHRSNTVAVGRKVVA